MSNINNVDTIIDDLVKSGSNINELESFKKEIVGTLKKDNSLEDTLEEISKDIVYETEKFLDKKNQFDVNVISGISTCIYLPDFENNGEYKLKLIGGNKSRNMDLKIDQNTMFDVASITKLYTMLLLLKLEELNMINLNDKICDINPEFPNLEDFTINDLVRLHGEPRTVGRIDDATSEKEAYDILHSMHLYSNTREENKYTDLGAIVIGDTIAKVISNKLGKEMTFNDVMYEYLLKPMELRYTAFNPKSDNLSGNNGNQVHDSKARLLGGALGHAGIFTTSDDLARLSREIYSLKYINKEHVNRLGEITFPNSKQSAKGNLGVYVKHPLGFDKTFTPSDYSTGSFAHQGWTGAMANFDPNNYIHCNVLVNAIYETDNKDAIKNNKPEGFAGAFDDYEANITRNIMLMYVAKKYYNRFCNVKEDIDEVNFIR